MAGLTAVADHSDTDDESTPSKCRLRGRADLKKYRLKKCNSITS